VSSEGENMETKLELAEGSTIYINQLKIIAKHNSEHSDCGLLGCETIQLCR
jgi:hypothetical protein